MPVADVVFGPVLAGAVQLAASRIPTALTATNAGRDLFMADMVLDHTERRLNN
jgi:hypothetical protein